jgi:hypothetical protein
MTWRSKAAWAFLSKDSEPIAAELWAIMGWEALGESYELFHAFYALRGDAFWPAIGYFPAVLDGGNTIDLAELHAASLYF